MSTISTHVLDTSQGRPAAGMKLSLDQLLDGAWVQLGGGITDEDGRVADLAPGGTLEPGTYRMNFDTGAWFEAQDTAGFYPEVRVVFRITAADEHHHVPLLISPFGYSTYRGS